MDLLRAAAATAVTTGVVLLASSGVELLAAATQEHRAPAAAVAPDDADFDPDAGPSSDAGEVSPWTGPVPDEVAAPAGPADVVLARPERLLIPAIGVDAGLVALTLEPDGRSEVPQQPEEAGWWSGGAAPGAPGPAVIAGHVDFKAGPAVFHRLRDLRRGDELLVAGEQGSVRYRVDGVEQHAKPAFPTDRVYGGTSAPTLRLVTCGGGFDRRAGHYDDNVVVFATAAPVPRGAPPGRYERSG